MTQVEKMSASTEKTKTLEALQEGTKLVSDCQKHKRLADRSELGWAKVKEYIEDVNEVDEKTRIELSIGLEKHLILRSQRMLSQKKKHFRAHANQTLLLGNMMLVI